MLFFVWDITGGTVLCVLVVVVVVDDDDTDNGVFALKTFGSVELSIGASVDFLEKQLRIPPKKVDFLVVGGGASVVTVDLINFCPMSALA